MALADDPREHILRMFNMEMRQSPDRQCRAFPDGTCPDGLPLDEKEFVFGSFKDAYFFTPVSLIIVENGAPLKIRWASIRACTSAHGDGHKTSTLTLIDGTSVNVDLQSFGPGWSSRISQLYHAMIQRWGAHAFSGFPLLSIAAFFEQAKGPHSIAPNLDPHPGLVQMRRTLEMIENAPGILSLKIDISDYDDGAPCSQRIVIVSRAPPTALAEALSKIGACAAFPADENIRRKVGAVEAGAEVFQSVWH